MVKQNCNTIQGLLCITEWRPLLADIAMLTFGWGVSDSVASLVVVSSDIWEKKG